MRFPSKGLFSPQMRLLDNLGIGLQRKGFAYKIFLILVLLHALYMSTALYELWLIRNNYEEALNNFSVSFVGIMVIIKCASLLSCQKRWRKLIFGLSRLEFAILSNNDKTSKTIIGKYVKYSRILGYIYAILVFGTNATFISQPFVRLASSEYRAQLRNGSETYQQIFSSWFPFDKTVSPGYWVSVAVHVFINLYGGLIIIIYDMSVVAVMVYIRGHLKILKQKCSLIFGDDDRIVSEKETEARIKECSIYHTSLFTYLKQMNKLLSPVMFVYAVGCSLTICGTVIQISNNTGSTTSLIQPIEYTLALLSELVLFCWHAQQVLDESDVVYMGVYQSAWWVSAARPRRLAALLMGQTQLQFIYNMGPTSKLTVVTILNIIRATYSYYTLLQNRN